MSSYGRGIIKIGQVGLQLFALKAHCQLSPVPLTLSNLLETIDNGSLLQTVPGIGQVSAATIIAETRGISRFQICSILWSYP